MGIHQPKGIESPRCSFPLDRKVGIPEFQADKLFLCPT